MRVRGGAVLSDPRFARPVCARAGKQDSRLGFRCWQAVSTSLSHQEHAELLVLARAIAAARQRPARAEVGQPKKGREPVNKFAVEVFECFR